MIFRRMALSSGFALAAVALLNAAPTAARTASLRDSLGASVDDRFATPMVGRFRSEQGDAFVVDRAPGRGLLLRFEPSPEIWVLHATAGPRGDVIYKNDVGEPMLRATRVGGLTLFTPNSPAGVAAAFAGPGPTLRPPLIITTGQLLRTYTQSSARVGRAAGRVVMFEARDVPIPAATLFADAAEVVVEAFNQVAARGDRRSRNLNRWKRVEFVMGKTPGADADGDTLRVIVTPEHGLAGRPSSSKIAQVIGRGR